ncbi:MAG TPA: hypothetical protein VGY58_11800, partial [Gemmataceae bacterium]|nr:hypothetical protein [Gemmataceae bacterium]
SSGARRRRCASGVREDLDRGVAEANAMVSGYLFANAKAGNVAAHNGVLVSDLLRSPGDAGRAFAFLVLGGNTFGLLAPILTGYIVAATGSFDSAFIVAGALAFVRAVAALVLARGTLGEHVRPHLARPGLACAAIAGPV